MRKLLLTGVVFIGLVVGGSALGVWLYANLLFGLTISDQPGTVLFPRETVASAMAGDKITIQLNGMIEAKVPFKQTLDLPLKGTYDTDASFDTEVPVEFTITYKGAIPVDSMAVIKGVTDFNYQKVKRLRNVEFTARIPLKFEQPVLLVVPVKAKLRLKYKGPLKLALDQTIKAPVDTILNTRLKAVEDITTPILSRFGMRVYWPDTPVPVKIVRTDIYQILNTLRLEKSAPPDPLPVREPVTTTNVPMGEP